MFMWYLNADCVCVSCCQLCIAKFRGEILKPVDELAYIDTVKLFWCFLICACAYNCALISLVVFLSTCLQI